MDFVNARFKLSEGTVNYLKGLTPPFGFNDFGEFIFYRTYSQDTDDGGKENWLDVVIRCIEGVFSIRKDWYIKNHISWDEEFWRNYSHHMAISMYRMQWLPPGRGLWMMGRNYIYERGSMALNNCGFTTIDDDIGDDFYWLMDCLMCGVGIGFMPTRNDDLEILNADLFRHTREVVIEDTREGWCDSIRLLINSYLGEKSDRRNVAFDYREIRPEGQRIKGFGGISSGPKPLVTLHEAIREQFRRYSGDSSLLKTNLGNLIGVGVVSGNVRRSAELACLPLSDRRFLDYKNYSMYPERGAFGWMSNNSAILETDEDFNRLIEIADRVVLNGEPGLINKRNLQYGRLRRNPKPGIDDLRLDKAIGFNPCGEQPLENKEVCNVVETVPTQNNCNFLKACEYATMYASTVSLLPTHSEPTNKVLIKNRRIGVSLMDVSGWEEMIGTQNLISNLRSGYAKVREINRWANESAGVPVSIRVTTVKPGGTVPKMVGKTGGFSWPTFHYTLMRVIVAKNSSVCKILDDAGVPKEQHLHIESSWVYEFPVEQGPAKPAEEISLWQQAALVVLLQREWSDNAVSNTLYFNPQTEAHLVEPVLSSIIQDVKSISLLPHMDAGIIPQSPQTKISKEEYDRRVAALKPFDWSRIKSDYQVEPEAYCQGDKCTLPFLST
jgi:ribonucleoside-triphosphate reductase